MTTAELHAHIFMDGKDYKACAARFANGVDESAVRSTLAAYQVHGITYVRDGGDKYGASLYAKKIAADFDIRYRTPAFALYKKGNYGNIVGLGYETLAEYTDLVKKAREAGADFIKLMLSGILDFNRYGVVSDTSYTELFVKELVHIAHEEGFSVMAHASGTREVRTAALSGADSIEHGYYMDGETMDMLADKGIVWVPTAVTSENLKGSARFDEDVVARIAAAHQDAIAEAAQKNVLIGCGSDAGAFCVCHGSGAAQEYELLKKLLGEKAEAVLRRALQIITEKF